MASRTRRYNDEDFDENGLLRDGRTARISLMMRDGDLTETQRQVRDAKNAPLRVVDSYGRSGLALRRPGPIYLTAGVNTADHAVLVAREIDRRRAYADSKQALQDAWKNPNTEVARVHNTGDAVRDAYLDQVHDLTTAWSRRR